MMLSKNRIVIACAGSGKTWALVKTALSLKTKKVLLVTYTNENLDQIYAYFIKQNGFLPANVVIQSWFSFILREGVRPYQNMLIDDRRMKSVFFKPGGITRYHKKNDYVFKSEYIYSDKASEFLFECDKKTKGKVIKRIENIYDFIFIDELQDLSGYDLDVLEQLFNSKLGICAVGDPRQATYSTNNSLKNKQYRGEGILKWLDKRKKKLIVESQNRSHRCNQAICDFADSIFPAMKKTISLNRKITGHDGIFEISAKDVPQYVETYRPVILRYNIKSNTLSYAAYNIGAVKGRTFERVLIFPTKNMIKFIKTKIPDDAGDKQKLYVAVTRARFSVAFVSK